MRKIFMLSAVMLLMCGACSETVYYENDGDSFETAYVIASSADLILMRDRVNNGTESNGKYYKLDSDIDMTSVTSWQPVGTLRHFTEHFDGQSHTIQINECLFSLISSDKGTKAVSNLNIIGNLSGDEAGLVYSLDSGIIENCSFKGSIVSYGNGTVLGGLAESVYEGGIIRNCTVSVDISSYSGEGAGGIAGEVFGGTIENCAVESGSVITASYVAGGIVSRMEGGSVKGCTVNADVFSGLSGGGIVGTARYTEAIIENCTVESGRKRNCNNSLRRRGRDCRIYRERNNLKLRRRIRNCPNSSKICRRHRRQREHQRCFFRRSLPVRISDDREHSLLERE